MTTVPITLARLASLLKDEAELRLLQDGGVDNWDWHGESLNPEGGPSLDEIHEGIDLQVADGTLTPGD